MFIFYLNQTLIKKHNKKHFNLVYNRCIINCPPGDVECFSVCSREYQSQLEMCPCESGCPQGCPCPEYQCPSGNSTTTTTQIMTTAATNNMAMLFLSTRYPRNEFYFELSFDTSYQSNKKTQLKVTRHG